jgi:hypothetical protein
MDLYATLPNVQYIGTFNLYLATPINILYIFCTIYCISYIYYRHDICHQVTDVTHTDERLTTFLTILPTFHQSKNKNNDFLEKFLTSNFLS